MMRALALAPLLLVACAGSTGDPAPFGGSEQTTTGAKESTDATLTPSSPRGDIDVEAPLGSSATAPQSAPKNGATVTLDGVAQTVTKIDMWSPDGDGDAHLFIDFDGKGAAVGTDLHVSFTKAADGCVASPKDHPQDLWLRPPASGDQYHSADGAGCGLSISAFPAKVGDALIGSFEGKVNGINGASGKTHTLVVKFTYVRAS